VRCIFRAARLVGLSWRGWGLGLVGGGGAVLPGSAQTVPAAVVAPAVPVAPVAAPIAPRFTPSLILDNRNSFIQASAVRIIGLNIGLTPRGKPYRLGLGGYTLRRSYSQLYTYSGKGKNAKLKDTFTPELNLTYFTPNFAYTFLNRRFVELSVPVALGLGRSHYTVTDENGKLSTDSRGLFFPAEIGLSVLLKPTRWVGVSAGAGYRVSLKAIDYREDFDGWYYSYRLNLFVGAIWADVRRAHHRWAAWRDARLPPYAPLPTDVGNP